MLIEGVSLSDLEYPEPGQAYLLAGLVIIAGGRPFLVIGR